ncbi:MAG: 3-hydroxybutyryl-CoA dehydrogenase [Candidatus Binatia bacterium]
MVIRNIAIIGAGQMGMGIGQVAAQAGFDVWLHDVAPAAITRGLDHLRAGLDRLVGRGKLTAAVRDEILSRMHVTPEFENLGTADFVIEAATEDEALKTQLFRRLNETCPPETILASNTSSISITRLGTASARPEKVIGMHFMNPPPVMRLVEIVRGLVTSDETYEVVKGLAERMGKTTMVAADSPGFVVNRVLVPMINEGIYAVHEGVGSVEAVDTAMKLGSNQPMGPLELADLIGLDTCLAIMEVMHNVLGDDKYRPCPLLRKYVDAGYLGRKTGRGFYRYTGD